LTEPEPTEQEKIRMKLVNALLTYMAPMYNPDMIYETNINIFSENCGVLNMLCSGKDCTGDLINAPVLYENIKIGAVTVECKLLHLLSPVGRRRGSKNCLLSFFLFL
jgi:hypothetical protein